MSYSRYPAYKDSGVVWLGEMPAHWQRKRLKFACEFNPSKSEIRDLPANMLVSFVPMERVGEDGSIDTSEKRTIEQLAGTYTYFRDGDVLVAKITPCFENGKGTYCRGLENGVGLGSTEFYVLRPTKYADSHFIFYLTYSQHFREQGTAIMYGAAGQQRISSDFVINFPLGLPPLPEQHAIVSFLDREIARIDTLIAKQESLIALLHEKRRALISHAVTKGLEPGAPMKESGVAWLGEVPAHWEVKRLKHCLLSIDQGWSPQCENRPAEENEWGVLKVGCVNQNQFNPLENKALPSDLEPVTEYIIRQDDVLVSRANTRELVGSAALATKDYPNLLLCDKLYRLRMDKCQCLPEFVVALLRTPLTRGQIEMEASGASQSMQNIAQDTIRNLFFALPTTAEQCQILSHIKEHNETIDTLIAKTQQFIALSREHRSALITAAVTGKIDVRGMVKGA